jgi:hypothetical protein
MNDQNRKEAKLLWLQLSAFYQVKLEPFVFDMYLDDIADAGLNYGELVHAMKLYRRNPKNRRPPLPADLIDLIKPAISDDAQARDTAARIVGAVKKFGNPPGERWLPEWRTYVGEIGLLAIQRRGGWAALCESLRDDQIPFVESQFRELVKSLMSLDRAGKLDQPAMLEGSERAKIASPALKELVASTIKPMEVK